MKVEVIIAAYETDACRVGEDIDVKIISHWNYKDRFWIEIEGRKYIFLRNTLEKAIANVCNHD